MRSEKQITYLDFKKNPTGYVNQVVERKVGRLLLTKRGRVVAKIETTEESGSFGYGALRDSVHVSAEADLTVPSGEVWGASDGVLYAGEKKRARR